MKKIILAVALILAMQVQAFAVSVDVPVHHWSYQAIERLSLTGLTDTFGFSMKPLTRMQMAEKIAKAISNIDNYDIDIPDDEQRFLDDLLYRLSEEYKGELNELGVYDAKEKGWFKHRFFDFQSEKIYASVDDKKRNVLWENKKGWFLKDGINLRFSLRSWIKLWNYVSASIMPAVRYSKNKTAATTEQLSVKFSAGNVETQVGRTSLWWGDGYHGALLLTDNAFPLDMVKISTQQPFYLPWIFKKIGKVALSVFYSELEKDRVTPKAKFGGWKIVFSPYKLLEFGIAKTAQFGGKGVGLSLEDYIEAYDFEQAGGENDLTNHLVSANFSLRLPNLHSYFPVSVCTGAKIYGEIGAEDEANGLPEFFAYVVGGYATDIFGVEGLGIRGEYAKTDLNWYTHFKHGDYRYKSSFMGHHMGGDAEDIYLRLSKQISEDKTIAFDFNRERSGISQTVVEKKYQFGMEFLYNLTEYSNVRIRYEYEDIDNIDNITSLNDKNSIIEIAGNIVW